MLDEVKKVTYYDGRREKDLKSRITQAKGIFFTGV